MDPAKWQRIETVFFAALEVEPDARDAFLDGACADDAALRAELAAILAAHTNPPPAAAGQSLAGLRVGAYRLEERIARGGMGEVYRAQRVDDQYRQEVAVKLVRPGPRADELIARFRVERQILANLQHPNIATLLEGGVTSSGQPYLVMQFVRGRPITEYADTHGLGMTERLRLFRTVCEAVQYAHANLVVHRDLKPSNILVTEEGQVRLLDFGIAKLLGRDAAADTDSHAAVQADLHAVAHGEVADMAAGVAATGELLLLTPEHAAPEQLLGRSITTATDVYALGVLLYELLTGDRPFRASTPHELYRAVCEQEPVLPSARYAAATSQAWQAARQRGARPAQLARQLRSGLDHVVRMAMHKAPEQRYGSAGQLGDDIARFLEGARVHARPDALGYRTARFVRRNRTAATLASLAVLLLIAGLLGTSWQAARAAAEAAQAAAERDRAERVSALLVDVFRIADPGSTRGETVTAREVLAQGAQRIVQNLEGQPEAQADLLTEIGQIYENLGLFEDAGPHLERAFALRRESLGSTHPRVGESLTRLAHLRLEQGSAAHAVELAEAAVAVLREGGGPRARSALIDALLTLGGALRNVPANEQAQDAFAEALALLDQQRGSYDPRYAGAFFGLAGAAHGQGQFDRADSLLQLSVTRHQQSSGAPDPDIAASLHDLAMLRMYRRRAAEAVPLLRRALDMRQHIYGTAHPAVAQTLIGLAEAQSLLGRHRDAIVTGRSAVIAADSAWGPAHVAAADARIALGAALINLDDGASALGPLSDAAASLATHLGPDSPRVIGVRIMMGQAHAATGRLDRAGSQFARALEQSDRALGPDHAFRAHLLLELARIDFESARLDRAERRARESLALTTRILRDEHRFALWARLLLAQIEAAHGRTAAADSLLRAVLAVQRETPGGRHPEIAATLTRLAELETRIARIDDAEAHAREAVDILEEAGARTVLVADARSVLGGVLLARQRVDEAAPLLRGAHADLLRTPAARPTQIAAAAARLRLLEDRQPLVVRR